MDSETLQPKVTNKGGKNSHYRISMDRRIIENAFGILVSHFRLLLDTMEQWPRAVRYIVFAYVVLYNMMTHLGRADWEPILGNDVAGQQNEPTVYVPNDKYRDPLREAKHQRELLKDYFNHVRVGLWAGGQ